MSRWCDFYPNMKRIPASGQYHRRPDVWLKRSGCFTTWCISLMKNKSPATMLVKYATSPTGVKINLGIVKIQMKQCAQDKNDERRKGFQECMGNMIRLQIKLYGNGLRVRMTR